VKPQVAEAIERHRAAGREFEAGGVGSFVREQGEGDPVVLMHGIPVSSYLYRKVLPLLAERGLRGVAFDLPGLGLAEKPAGFDYSWSGLGRWTGEAIDGLGIESCHLVLHDIGGPIGLEWGAPQSRANQDTDGSRHADRRRALPAGCGAWIWAAAARDRPALGGDHPPAGRPLALLSAGDRRPLRDTPRTRVDAHIALLHRDGGGRSFRQIVQGFELTEEKERFYVDGLREAGWPCSIVWGERDPALGADRRRAIEEALGVEATVVPAKHFLQEDQAEAVAEATAKLASRS